MKLKEAVSKLRNVRFTASDFHIPDVDRSGEVLLALALVAAMTCLVLVK